MAKGRSPYSCEDETRMWMYLYEQLRKGVQAAWQPKGLEIWKMYALENVGRTADSLNTRFRKIMINRLYDANLPCHVMMYLYSQYQIPMGSDVKTALELKFQIQIELKSSGTLKSFEQIPRYGPPVQAGKSDIEQIEQIHKVKRDSVKKPRLEGVTANRDHAIVVEESEDVKDLGETQSPARIASHDDSPAHQADEGPFTEPGQLPSSNEAIIMNDVTVSTTSDSCQKALDRCSAAYGVETSSKDEDDWRSSEDAIFLTSKFHAEMKELVASHKLTAEDTERTIAAVLKKQKKLLVESKTESDYLQSLLSAKSTVKRKFDRLSAAFRSPSPRRPFVKLPEEGFPLQMRNVESVGIANREEALGNIVTSNMSNSLHPAHIATTLNELENVEELVAASSTNKEDYNAKMKEVEDAIKKKVSATLKM